MVKYLFVFAYTAVLLHLPGIAQETLLNKQHLIQDLSAFCTHLEENQSIFSGTVRQSVMAYRDSLAAALPDTVLSPYAYTWYVREAVWHTQDVHTYLMQTPPVEVTDSSRFRLLPWSFGIFGDQLLLTTSAFAPTLLAGDTILRINGIPAAEIRYKLSRYYPSDYPNSFNFSKGLVENRSSWLFFRTFGGQDSCVIVVKKGQSSTALKTASIRKELSFNQSFTPSLTENKIDVNSIRYFIDKKIKLSYIMIDKKAFDIEYNNTYGQIVSKLLRDKTEVAIIDLRKITGAPLTSVHLFVSLISGKTTTLTMSPVSQAGKSAPAGSYGFHAIPASDSLSYTSSFIPQTTKASCYQGKYILLCNENTSSAGVLAAYWFKQLTGATVIGTETGGSAYTFSTLMAKANGERPVFTLPHSGIRIQIPTGTAVLQPANPAGETGLIPDILIVPSATYLATGKDPALERAIEEAKKMLQQQ